MDAEYEIQCFGFSVEQFQYELHQLFKLQVHNVAAQLAESIITASPDINTEIAPRIRSQVGSVVQGILKTSEHVMKEVDNLIGKTFTIPENVVLAEDLVKVKSGGSEMDEEMLKSKQDNLYTLFKQNIQFLNVMDYEIGLHKELESLIEKETEIADKVESALLTSISLIDEKIAVAKCVETFQSIEEGSDVQQ